MGVKYSLLIANVSRDPLFQKALVEVVRENPQLFGSLKSSEDNDWSGLPIIFDEVFTGFYRLGRINAGSFIGVEPDISIHAKLLTGGLVPLSVTLASEPIFKAFLSNDKTDALLHGHSYTAHPIGCNVANESLKTLSSLNEGSAWSSFKHDWQQISKQQLSGIELWSMWSTNFIYEVSRKSVVEGVFSLGSVLAITIKDSAVSGKYDQFSD